MIVVDASVLTDFLLGSPWAMRELDEAMAEDVHQPLHAPELVEPETLNALRRLASSKAVSDRRATEAAADLDDLRLVRHPHAPLRPRVWALRHVLPAYDACYLALAEALPDSVMLTADAGLAAQARRSLGSERVRRPDVR